MYWFRLRGGGGGGGYVVKRRGRTNARTRDTFQTHILGEIGSIA